MKECALYDRSSQKNRELGYEAGDTAAGRKLEALRGPKAVANAHLG